MKGELTELGAERDRLAAELKEETESHLEAGEVPAVEVDTAATEAQIDGLVRQLNAANATIKQRGKWSVTFNPLNAEQVVKASALIDAETSVPEGLPVPSEELEMSAQAAAAECEQLKMELASVRGRADRGRRRERQTGS